MHPDRYPSKYHPEGHRPKSRRELHEQLMEGKFIPQVQPLFATLTYIPVQTSKPTLHVTLTSPAVLLARGLREDHVPDIVKRTPRSVGRSAAIVLALVLEEVSTDPLITTSGLVLTAVAGAGLRPDSLILIGATRRQLGAEAGLRPDSLTLIGATRRQSGAELEPVDLTTFARQRCQPRAEPAAELRAEPGAEPGAEPRPE
jgi:hypothetical protein